MPARSEYLWSSNRLRNFSSSVGVTSVPVLLSLVAISPIGAINISLLLSEHHVSATLAKRSRKTVKSKRPPGPKGSPIMGVMREFNRDSLGFIARCARDHGDGVWMGF